MASSGSDKSKKFIDKSGKIPSRYDGGNNNQGDNDDDDDEEERKKTPPKNDKGPKSVGSVSSGSTLAAKGKPLVLASLDKKKVVVEDEYDDEDDDK